MDEAKMNLGETIEKLCVVNIKLFGLCDKKAEAAANPDKFSKEDLIELMDQDIKLCKERARLKGQINKAIGSDIEEIKRYGQSS